MQTKLIVVGTVIALITGVGSVSADEITVDRNAVNTGTPFAMLNVIATPMSDAELEAVRGLGRLEGGDISSFGGDSLVLDLGLKTSVSDQVGPAVFPPSDPLGEWSHRQHTGPR